MPRIMAILFLSLSTARTDSASMNAMSASMLGRRACLTLILTLALTKVEQLSHPRYWHCGRHSERHPSLP